MELCLPLLYLYPRAIVSALDLMKIDMVNFALTTIKPHLMQQSAEYERHKFQEFLEKQPSEERLGFLNIIKDVVLVHVQMTFLDVQLLQMPWTTPRSGFETQRRPCETPRPPHRRCRRLTASITMPTCGFSSGTTPQRPSLRFVCLSCTFTHSLSILIQFACRGHIKFASKEDF